MGYKINMLSLRPFARVYGCIREEGNQIYSSVFLDLKEGYILFVNSSVWGRIKMEVLDAPNVESDDGFFVAGDKFFAMAAFYAEAIVDKDHLRTLDGDFALAPLHESYVFPSFDQANFSHQFDIKMSSDDPKETQLIGVELKKVAFAAMKEDSDALGAVFVRDDRVCAFNGEIYADRGIPSTGVNAAIPLYLWHIIEQMPFPSVSVAFDAEPKPGVQPHVCIAGGQKDGDLDFVLISTFKTEYSIYDPHDDEFRQAFLHPKTVIVSRTALLQNLAFLDIFTQRAPNSRCKVTVRPKAIIFRVIDDGTATQELEAEVDSGLIQPGEFFWIKANFLRLAVESLDAEDRVCLAFDYDTETVDVRNLEKKDISSSGHAAWVNHVAISTLDKQPDEKFDD